MSVAQTLLNCNILTKLFHSALDYWVVSADCPVLYVIHATIPWYSLHQTLLSRKPSFVSIYCECCCYLSSSSRYLCQTPSQTCICLHFPTDDSCGVAISMSQVQGPCHHHMVMLLWWGLHMYVSITSTMHGNNESSKQKVCKVLINEIKFSIAHVHVSCNDLNISNQQIFCDPVIHSSILQQQQ